MPDQDTIDSLTRAARPRPMTVTRAGFRVELATPGEIQAGDILSTSWNEHDGDQYTIAHSDAFPVRYENIGGVDWPVWDVYVTDETGQIWRAEYNRPTLMYYGVVWDAPVPF